MSGKELILPKKYQKPKPEDRDAAMLRLTQRDLADMRTKIAAEMEKTIRQSLEGEQAAMLRESLRKIGWIPPDSRCANCAVEKDCEGAKVFG